MHNAHQLCLCSNGVRYKMERLTADFFQRDPATCARELIGCVLLWKGLRRTIVETEAYAAEGDEACHTWFRPSARKFVAEYPPGTAYVYLNYGIHWLFNILVKGGMTEGFVLIRALESKEHPRLGAGPGKLTKMLGIDGSAHGVAFLENEETGIFCAAQRSAVITGRRIGISRAKELPWRFGAADSAALSAKFDDESS